MRNLAVVFLAGPLFMISVEDEAVVALLAIMIPVSWIWLLGFQLKVEKTEEPMFKNWEEFEGKIKEVGTKLSEELSGTTQGVQGAATRAEARAEQTQDLFKKETKKAAQSVHSPD